MLMRKLFTVGFLLIAIYSHAQSFLRLADSVRRVRGIPAITFAVFSDSVVIESGATGYKKYRTRDSVKVTDRFQLGTNTFAITSWIAAKLVESGRIKWTSTFTSLFPESKNKVLAQFSNVDLKTLLANKAGIAPYKSIEDFSTVPAFNSDAQIQRKEFAVWLLQRPGLSADRNNQMVESIAGYTVAAAMLEKASGLSWDKLIDNFFNKPLGVAAKFGWPNTLSPNEPWGHWAKYGGLTPEAHDTWVKPYPATVAVSSVNLNVIDYAKFLQDELKGLRGGTSKVTKANLELIHFGEPDYALGWQNTTINGQRVAMHTGESALFSVHAELIPGKNIGIIVMCNDGDSMGKGGVINLCRLIRESYLVQ